MAQAGFMVALVGRCEGMGSEEVGVSVWRGRPPLTPTHTTLPPSPHTPSVLTPLPCPSSHPFPQPTPQFVPAYPLDPFPPPHPFPHPTSAHTIFLHRLHLPCTSAPPRRGRWQREGGGGRKTGGGGTWAGERGETEGEWVETERVLEGHQGDIPRLINSCSCRPSHAKRPCMYLSCRVSGLARLGS